MKIKIVVLCLMIIYIETMFPIKSNRTYLKRMDKIDDNNIIINNKSENLISKDYSRIEAWGKCMASLNSTIYDINPVNLDKCKTYTISSNYSDIDFNLCSDVQTHCDKKGLVVDRKNCISYSSDSSKDKLWRKQVINSTDEKIILSLPPGDPCPIGGNMTVTIELICDKKIVNPTIINGNEFDNKKCNNTIVMKTKHVCNGSKYEPWYEKGNRFINCILLIIFGVLYMFWGYKYEIGTIPILIAITTGLIIHSIGPTIPAIACICFGLAIALMTHLLEKIIYFVIIIILGNILSTIIFNIFIKAITEDTNEEAVYWIIVVICVVILLIIHTYIETFLKIMITSITGSYMACRSISLLIGYFPDEFYFSQLIRNHEYNQINEIISESLILFYVLTYTLFILISIFFQYYNKDDVKKELKKQEINKHEVNKIDLENKKNESNKFENNKHEENKDEENEKLVENKV